MSILPNKLLQMHAALVDLVESRRQFLHAVRQLTHTVGTPPQYVTLPDLGLELRWSDCPEAWTMLVELGGDVRGDEVVLVLQVDGATAIATRRPAAREPVYGLLPEVQDVLDGPGLLPEPEWN